MGSKARGLLCEDQQGSVPGLLVCPPPTVCVMFLNTWSLTKKMQMRPLAPRMSEVRLLPCDGGGCLAWLQPSTFQPDVSSRNKIAEESEFRALARESCSSGLGGWVATLHSQTNDSPRLATQYGTKADLNKTVHTCTQIPLKIPASSPLVFQGVRSLEAEHELQP